MASGTPSITPIAAKKNRVEGEHYFTQDTSENEDEGSQEAAVADVGKEGRTVGEVRRKVQEMGWKEGDPKPPSEDLSADQNNEGDKEVLIEDKDKEEVESEPEPESEDKSNAVEGQTSPTLKRKASENTAVAASEDKKHKSASVGVALTALTCSHHLSQRRRTKKQRKRLPKTRQQMQLRLPQLRQHLRRLSRSLRRHSARSVQRHHPLLPHHHQHQHLVLPRVRLLSVVRLDHHLHSVLQQRTSQLWTPSQRRHLHSHPRASAITPPQRALSPRNRLLQSRRRRHNHPPLEIY